MKYIQQYQILEAVEGTMTYIEINDVDSVSYLLTGSVPD